MSDDEMEDFTYDDKRQLSLDIQRVRLPRHPSLHEPYRRWVHHHSLDLAAVGKAGANCRNHQDARAGAGHGLGRVRDRL